MHQFVLILNIYSIEFKCQSNIDPLDCLIRQINNKLNNIRCIVHICFLILNLPNLSTIIMRYICTLYSVLTSRINAIFVQRFHK